MASPCIMVSTDELIETPNLGEGGGLAVPHWACATGNCRVYWYNPSTGELEIRIAKSLHLHLAETHAGGMAGWQAEADHEVAALGWVAGVPGAVRYLETITEASGAIHLIFEYAPLCPTSDLILLPSFYVLGAAVQGCGRH